MNSRMMEGSSFSPQMNRGLSACPASELVYRSPPPPPVFNGLHCLTLPAHPDLFVLLKKKKRIMFLEFCGIKSLHPIIFY